MIRARDEFDQTLIQNVRPPDWKNPPPGAKFDLVAIGAGTAGLISAAGAAALGARTALVERSHFGGDCLNVGCVPSKSLLRSAQVAAEVRDAERFGVRVPDGVEVDFPAVLRRMREVRARISPVDSVERYANELGVSVYLGEARFTSPTSIEVDGAPLHFKKAVVATGTHPRVPPIPGLAEAGCLTNETVFDLSELPNRLVVLGGGPIGCELAQAFRRFGAEVTLIEMSSHLLSREDPDASEILLRAFERDGIRVCLDATAAQVATGSGPRAEKRVTLDSKGRSETLCVDEILVGAGRIPNVEDLGLDAAGVEHDLQRGIIVDDYLRTSNRRVFAAGDVCLESRFTHAAEFAARSVIQNALLFPSKRISGLTIPRCTYTSPEIAHVGLCARDAAARGVPIDTWMHAFADVDRAIADGDRDGFVKIHTKKASDKIVGATVVARHAGDLISEISVAMAGGLGLGRLTAVIHPYPTQADAIRQVANSYNRTRLTPGVKRLFEWLIRIKR